MLLVGASLDREPNKEAFKTLQQVLRVTFHSLKNTVFVAANDRNSTTERVNDRTT